MMTSSLNSTTTATTRTSIGTTTRITTSAWSARRARASRSACARAVSKGRPRAVVQEAFATFVRDFIRSNRDLDQEVFDEIFQDIFAGIANEYIMEDAGAETFDGFGSDEHLAAQTARMKAELRKASRGG